MKATRLKIDPFLENSKKKILIDVRTPSEYSKGHIPSAVNIPVFSDSERAEIGTLYKQEGRIPAVRKGLETAGPRLAGFMTEILALQETYQSDEVYIHCWRGGLRSNCFAWIAELSETKTFILEGGYKAYRNKTLSVFEDQFKIVLLSGETGCGKTEILKELQKTGEQIIDLEGLAHHRGSVFGDIGREKQPTSQQFENNLADALLSLDKKRWVWFENESPVIGNVYIPSKLLKQMKAAPVIQISLPREIRAQRLLNEYSGFDLSEVAEKINVLKKYLGNKNCSSAINGIKNGELKTTLEILLNYYDKTYDYYLKKYNKAATCSLGFVEDDMVKNALAVKTSAEKNIFSLNQKEKA